MSMVSERLAILKASAPMLVDERKKLLTAGGRDIVSFCVGEPDFAAPACAGEAASAVIKSGARYTNASGTPELKKAVAAALLRDSALAYAPEQVVVTTGAKYAVYAAVLALTDAGDEVVLPAPYWTSYPAILRLAGAAPVVVPCTADSGWKLTPEALIRALTSRTRALILNNPNNPSGAVYTRAELAALAGVCRDAGIAVIADEIYAGLVYDGASFAAAAAVDADMFSRTVTVSGVSKTYAMTGYRIGYAAAGDAGVVCGMSALLSHTTGCPSAVSQAAAAAALSGPQDGAERMRQAFARRRELLDAALTDAGILHTRPQGAFYMMADIRPYLSPAYPDDLAFALALLEQAGVATAPLSAFGLDGFLRLSYTLADARIAEGARRMAAFCRACVEERV